MKLIAEYLDNELEVVTEAREGGGKDHFIEGIFAQAEGKNRNGRIYEKAIMEKAVDKYVNEQVSQNRAVGELNHPEGPTVNLDKVSHRITEMNWNGNNVMGQALIQLGVSTRGMGTLEQRGNAMYVKDDYILNTVDIVQDPSAPDAFVNGIMEGVEWVWNNGVIQVQEIERMETEIKAAPRTDLYETQVREFKNFLSLLKNK